MIQLSPLFKHYAINAAVPFCSPVVDLWQELIVDEPLASRNVISMALTVIFFTTHIFWPLVTVNSSTESSGISSPGHTQRSMAHHR